MQPVDFMKYFPNVAVPADIKAVSDEALLDMRHALVRGLSELVDKAEIESRNFTKDEGEAFEHAEFLTRKIDLERQRRNDERPAPRSFSIESKTASVEGNNGGPRPASGKRDYRSVFCKNGERPSWGKFRDAEDFYRSIHSNQIDPRLIEARTMIEGIGSLGGAVVPSALSEEIWSPAFEESIFLSKARIFPLERGSSLSIPIVMNHDRSVGPFGVVPRWMGEEQTATSQDLTYTNVDISTYNLMLYATVSNRLIADAIAGFELQLTSTLKKALAFSLDQAFLTGNGVAKPLGVLNDPAMLAVGRNTAGSIKFVDIVNMYSRLLPGSANGAIWLVHPTCVPQLCQLTDPAGNTTWLPNLAGNAPGSLLGRPVIVTEKVPELGSQGDIILCDPSYYAVVLRKELTLEKSNAPHWAQDQTDYRVGVRVGGMGLLMEPVIPASGTTTLSWIVTLS